MLGRTLSLTQQNRYDPRIHLLPLLPIRIDPLTQSYFEIAYRDGASGESLRPLADTQSNVESAEKESEENAVAERAKARAP